MIEAAKLISDLAARGVKVKIPAANKLRLTGPRDAVEAFRNEVLRRKFEIISILERKAKSGGQKRHVAPQARNVPYILGVSDRAASNLALALDGFTSKLPWRPAR